MPFIKAVARFLCNGSCVSWPTDRMGFCHKPKDFTWNWNLTPRYVIYVHKFVVIPLFHRTRILITILAKCQFIFYTTWIQSKFSNPISVRWLTLKTEAGGSFEKSAHSYNTIRHHIRNGSNFQKNWCLLLISSLLCPWVDIPKADRSHANCCQHF